MDISLHLHDPDELKAFARFCNDMADVRVKQRGRTESPAEPLVRAFEQAHADLTAAPVTAAAVSKLRDETQVTMMEAKSALVQAGGNAEQARALLLPPSLEEAQRAAAVRAAEREICPPVPAPTSVGFDTQALADDAAKLFGLGVNPMTGQPVGAMPPAVPLPPSGAPSTAAAAVFPTVPVALPAGVLPPSTTLPAPLSVPSVAAPTAAATTSPAGGVELDADGLPWDARIHSSSKEKNKSDGRWRAKRGVNDEVMVKRVQAELRAVMAISAPMPLAQIPAPPVTLHQVPPAAPVGVAPSIPQPPAAATDPTDFASLIAVLTPRLTPDRMPKIFEIVQSFGLPGLPALQQRPDLVPAVWAKLKEHLG